MDHYQPKRLQFTMLHHGRYPFDDVLQDLGHPRIFPGCRRRLFSQVDRQDEPIEATEGDVIEQD